jgi:peptidoglycan/LPS O-acetylase OafA/YrhL
MLQHDRARPAQLSGSAAWHIEKPNWHLGRLDALRGLAILAVLVVHSAGVCAFPEFTGGLLANGQRGVQLFFIVSAFTLFLSLENRRRTEARPTLNYFIRRFFRLAPLYYLAILLGWWLIPGATGTAGDVILGVLFLQGLSPHAITHVAAGTWSIADEAFFYGTLPLLVRYIRSFRAALIALLIASPVLALGSLLLNRRNTIHFEYFSFLWFPIEFPVFLLGVAIYFLWKQYLAPHAVSSRTRSLFLSHPRLLSLLLLACAACIVLSDIPLNNRKLYPTSLACALIVFALLLHAWPLFVNRFTIYLGKISFSVYLLHFFAIGPIVRFALARPALVARPWLMFAIILTSTLVITAAIASLTWLYIEETGIRLGRRLIAHLEHRAVSRQDTELPSPPAALTSPSSSQDAQF